MRWKKSLMMVLVFVAAIVVNVQSNFAKGPLIPGNVWLEYEGNKQEASQSYFRVSVKYESDGGKAVVPNSLIIYETNLTPKEGEETNAVEVHRHDFGEDAGITLKEVGEKPYLEALDKFAYRTFIARHKPMRKFKYKAVLTWELDSGEKRRETVEIEVNVKQEISKRLFTVGSANMFSRENWIDRDKYKGLEYVPKLYIKEGKDGEADKQFGYSDTYLINNDWSKKIEAENDTGGVMDVEWNNKSAITGLKGTIADKVFIANASLKMHVVYVGEKPLGENDKVMAYVKNNSATDNSLGMGDKREIPALSKKLTELGRKSQTHPDYDAGVYPKTKEDMEIYMGLGSGPQGDAGKNDNKNDVAFIFGTSNGVIKGDFELHVLNEKGDPAPGFVFDYITLTYNPIIFTSGIQEYKDGFIKPEGYLMLNTGFELEDELPGGQTKIENAKIKLSLKTILNGEMKDYTEFLNNNYSLFDGSGITLWIGDTEIKPCDGIAGCSHEGKGNEVAEGFNADNRPKCEENTYVYYPGTQEIVIYNAGEINVGHSKIKMIIPTRRKESSKSMTDYNHNVVGKLPSEIAEGEVPIPGKTYPIKMEIIENHHLLEDSGDELMRYEINFKINPYRMPNIN